MSRLIPHTTPAHLKQLGCAWALSLVMLLSGCSSYTQSSSGSEYLARYNTPEAATPEEIATQNQQWLSADAAVRAAASVEPTLRFPARIGVAYISEFNRLEGIPDSHSADWHALNKRLSPAIGELVPINPLIAAVAMANIPQQQQKGLRESVTKIRIAAARQHLDAVLVYETAARSDNRRNALSLANLSIVGAWVVPTRNLSSAATGTATLIDVLSGYHYGTVTAAATEEAVSTAAHSYDQTSALEQRLRQQAASQVIGELDAFFNTLWKEADARGKHQPKL